LAERSLTVRIASIAILTSFLLGAACPSQPPPSSPLQTTSGTGFTGAPYSGTETTVDIKTAADGTRYSNTNVMYLWRDAEGRTRQEHLEKSPSGIEIHSVIITDPIAGVYLKWSYGDESMPKVMTIQPLAERQRVRAPAANQYAYATTSQYAPSSGAPRSCGNGCTVETERLAPQAINGVNSFGTRTTRTFKAGTAENGQSLVVTVTNELWISPDLAIIVRHINDDGRTGQSETDVTDVERVDPDPSLFAAPEGYQVRDMRPRAADIE
jgi:hypothetical protein